MLDARRQSILVAALAGLAVGALGWLVLGSGSLDRRLDALDDLVTASAPAPPTTVAIAVQGAATARARPLFQRPAQAGAPVSVRLDGVSVRPGASSALLAVGGAAAQWMERGDTVSGVTLTQVRAASAVIDTGDGEATLSLGQTWTPPVSAPAAGPGSSPPAP